MTLSFRSNLLVFRQNFDFSVELAASRRPGGGGLTLRERRDAAPVT